MDYSTSGKVDTSRYRRYSVYYGIDVVIETALRYIVLVKNQSIRQTNNLRAPTKNKDAWRRNKILLNSGSLHNYGLNRLFELASRAGYDGIELVIDNDWDTRQSEYIRKLEKQFGIKVLSIHSAMEFMTVWGPDPKIRHRESIKLAKKIGVKHIVIHPHDYNDEGFYDWIKTNYQQFIDLAKPIKISFENHTTRRSAYQSDKNFFDRFPLYTLDTSHIATAKLNLSEILDQIGNKLAHIHLSDSDFAKRPRLPKLIADRHMIPGTGKLPLKEFLQKLRTINYSGYIVTELLPESIGAGKSDAVILKNLKKALEFTRENLK